MNPQVTNLVMMLGLMQAAKKIPFEDEKILNLLRACYLLSNIIILGIYAYVGMVINKKNDMTTMKYVEPAAPLSGEEPKAVTTTIKEYDQTQLKAAYKSTLMGIGMMAFMHIYMKYSNPLFIQSIMPLKSAFESNLVKVHIFGKPAAGDLKRPWKASGFMGAAGAGETKTDKKSIENAEKVARGGAKEE
ncbi:inorganic phosphate transport PHO88 [Ascobolus immersus RN42]|uniref:Inorganic phosphate transport PHO88 n=1 Tax=Ascobolus immersus RN42 TaxID=1160509 RepID=A0A3N4HJV9_ASCIM|nr:inorganic phosphate transport PHO88 [Ascobolus immersus RN42]